jgi:hypothetical protein
MPYPENTVLPLFEAATKAAIAEERRLERLARCERGEIALQDVRAAIDEFVDEMVYGRGQAVCNPSSVAQGPLHRACAIDARTGGVSPLRRGGEGSARHGQAGCTSRCGAAVNDNAGHADQYHPQFATS